MQPTFDNVLILPSTQKKVKSKGGIYLPDIIKEKTYIGTVIAVGPGAYANGQRVPPDIKIDDEVVYVNYGTDIVVDGEQYILINEADIIAIL